jgi:transcriptional regulator with XRE-family HTH domain
LKQFRQMLCCSQNELAAALGISQSLLAQIESGKRKLPVESSKIYTEMMISFEEAEPGPDDIKIEKASKTEPHRLNKRKKNLEALGKYMTEQLNSARLHHSESLKMEKAMKNFKITATGRLAPVHRNWKNLVVLTQQVRKQNNGLPAQNDLRLEIARIYAEIDTINIILAESEIA